MIDEQNKEAVLLVRNTETDKDRFFKLTEKGLLIGSGEECDVRCDGIVRQAIRVMPVGKSLWVRREQDENGFINADYIGLGDDDYRIDDRLFEEGKYYFQRCNSYPSNIQDFDLAGGDDFNP